MTAKNKILEFMRVITKQQKEFVDLRENIVRSNDDINSVYVGIVMDYYQELHYALRELYNRLGKEEIENKNNKKTEGVQ